MSAIRVFLLAGSTGSGKSTIYRTKRDELRQAGVLTFDFDLLMHEATLTAFPYFVGGDKLWDKSIWRCTKGLVDSTSAMLRTIRHIHTYHEAIKSSPKSVFMFGYQFEDSHWVQVASEIVRELANQDCHLHLCWLHPPAHVVIKQRQERKHSHDTGGPESMRKAHEEYGKTLRYDSKVSTSEEAYVRLRQFFDGDETKAKSDAGLFI